MAAPKPRGAPRQRVAPVPAQRTAASSQDSRAPSPPSATAGPDGDEKHAAARGQPSLAMTAHISRAARRARSAPGPSASSGLEALASARHTLPRHLRAKKNQNNTYALLTIADCYCNAAWPAGHCPDTKTCMCNAKSTGVRRYRVDHPCHGWYILETTFRNIEHTKLDISQAHLEREEKLKHAASLPRLRGHGRRRAPRSIPAPRD